MTFGIKREKKCMLSGEAWGKRAVYCELSGWPESFSLVCVAELNSAYSPLVIPHYAPQCPNNSKSLGERAGPAVSQHNERLQPKHIRCDLSPLLFHSLQAKSCSRHCIYKRLGSRQGCAETAVNPCHVCSVRNTRHKAYWIKGPPD